MPPPRPAGGTRRADTARLIVFNTGAVAVVAGMVTGWWPAIVVGGCVVAGVAGWHGTTLLKRLRSALPSRFGHTVRYYIAAAAMLPIGAGIGIAMANVDLPSELHERLVLAHAAVNVLGWVGLTVLGTLVTLWPTMLRTRMAERVETAARRGLPALLLALAVGVVGAIAGTPLVTAAGALGYLAAAVYVLEPHLDEIRRKHPADFATLSVLAGIMWLLGSLTYLTVGLATASTPLEATETAGSVTAALLAGFLVQVLLGALTYLVPVVIGGRAAVQGAMTELERGAPWRLSITNAGLLVCVLPVPSLVRVACSVLVLVAFASFLPLAVRAVLVARRMRGMPSKPGRPEPVPAHRRIRPPQQAWASSSSPRQSVSRPIRLRRYLHHRYRKRDGEWAHHRSRGADRGHEVRSRRPRRAPGGSPGGHAGEHRHRSSRFGSRQRRPHRTHQSG